MAGVSAHARRKAIVLPAQGAVADHDRRQPAQQTAVQDTEQGTCRGHVQRVVPRRRCTRQRQRSGFVVGVHDGRRDAAPARVPGNVQQQRGTDVQQEEQDEEARLQYDQEQDGDGQDD